MTETIAVVLKTDMFRKNFSVFGEIWRGAYGAKDTYYGKYGTWYLKKFSILSQIKFEVLIPEQIIVVEPTLKTKDKKAKQKSSKSVATEMGLGTQSDEEEEALIEEAELSRQGQKPPQAKEADTVEDILASLDSGQPDMDGFTMSWWEKKEKVGLSAAPTASRINLTLVRGKSYERESRTLVRGKSYEGESETLVRGKSYEGESGTLVRGKSYEGESGTLVRGKSYEGESGTLIRGKSYEAESGT